MNEPKFYTAADFDMENIERLCYLEKLELDFYELEKITDKWGFLRQIYMELLPWIMEGAKKDVTCAVIPYPVDWSRYMSPIEISAWYSIRSHYIPMYPQFPVFNYFIDFANPYLRIGLELDGEAYHDPKKDKARDKMLLKYGWKIFRVTGKEANYDKYKPFDLIQQDYQEHHQDEMQYQREISDWMMNSCDGVVKALKLVYFDHDHESPLYITALNTLYKHKCADFYIP